MNIDDLMKNNPLNLTRDTVYQRIKRGWAEDKIMKVPPQKCGKPDPSHPYRSASYQRMAERKGWK